MAEEDLKVVLQEVETHLQLHHLKDKVVPTEDLVMEGAVAEEQLILLNQLVINQGQVH